MVAVPVSSLSLAIEAMQARLDGLDAAPYQRDTSGRVVDAFRRAITPFELPEQDATAHLEYLIIPQVSEVDDLARGAEGLVAKCRAALDVSVRYELRATSQDADLKLALDCAADVLRALCAESRYLGALGRVVPRQLVQLAPVDEQLALEIVVGVTLLHEVSL
jgi:hypothetical protein